MGVIKKCFPPLSFGGALDFPKIPEGWWTILSCRNWDRIYWKNWNS